MTQSPAITPSQPKRECRSDNHPNLTPTMALGMFGTRSEAGVEPQLIWLIYVPI
jgi:hypothetical protein